MKSPFLFVLLAFGLACTACKEDEIINAGESDGYFYGETAQLGQGVIKTYTHLDVEGAPTEIGIIVPESSMNSLDGQMPSMFSLDLPAKARAKTAYQHMMFDWMPHGHEPDGIFDLPHFDLHYYYTSEAERMAIGATDTVQFMKPVTEGYIPAPYINIGGVPQMGAHWINPTDPVFEGETFTEVFLYGSYGGAVTFIEPMMTKAYVVQTKNFERNMLQPDIYPEAGKYYPTVYGVKYDTAKKEYRFYVSGFAIN